MIGHSIFDLTHPCDHDDIRDLITDKRRHSIASGANSDTRPHYDFFVRMKSNYLSKANFSTFKSSSYRVSTECLMA
jgi:hypoxia-inducible factor 1 alpha